MPEVNFGDDKWLVYDDLQIDFQEPTPEQKKTWGEFVEKINSIPGVVCVTRVFRRVNYWFLN